MLQGSSEISQGRKACKHGHKKLISHLSCTWHSSAWLLSGLSGCEGEWWWNCRGGLCWGASPACLQLPGWCCLGGLMNVLRDVFLLLIFFFFLMRQGKFSNTSCCQNRRRISSDHLLLPTVSFAWLLGALWKLLQLTELTEGKLNSFLPSWRLPWRVHSAVDWAEGMEWCEAGEGGTKPLCFRTLASWLHLNLQCGICRGEHSEARGSAAL